MMCVTVWWQILQSSSQVKVIWMKLQYALCKMLTFVMFVLNITKNYMYSI